MTEKEPNDWINKMIKELKEVGLRRFIENRKQDKNYKIVSGQFEIDNFIDDKN